MLRLKETLAAQGEEQLRLLHRSLDNPPQAIMIADDDTMTSVLVEAIAEHVGRSGDRVFASPDGGWIVKTADGRVVMSEDVFNAIDFAYMPGPWISLTD